MLKNESAQNCLQLKRLERSHRCDSSAVNGSQNRGRMKNLVRFERPSKLQKMTI